MREKTDLYISTVTRLTMSMPPCSVREYFDRLIIELKGIPHQWLPLWYTAGKNYKTFAQLFDLLHTFSSTQDPKLYKLLQRGKQLYMRLDSLTLISSVNIEQELEECPRVTQELIAHLCGREYFLYTSLDSWY